MAYGGCYAFMLAVSTLMSANPGLGGNSVTRVSRARGCSVGAALYKDSLQGLGTGQGQVTSGL